MAAWGKATLSGRIELVQDDRQRPAFEFFLPIYLQDLDIGGQA